MRTQQDWEWLAVNSHYQTAIAVRQLLEEGKSMEATVGLNELIEAMARSDRRALKSQLIRLMSHIIKWKFQPDKRSRSWIFTIIDAREEIRDTQSEVPSLNRDYIESIWDKCFQKAVRQAEGEMDMDCDLTSLSWAEVFETEYAWVQPD
jgi:hypothetical protein